MNLKVTLLLIVCVLLTCTQGVFANEQEGRELLSVRVDQVISERYPDVKAYLSVQDSKGSVVQGLAPSLFTFLVDSQDIGGKSSVVPFSMKSEPIDYTILFSNSGIMDGEPLDFQKTAILQFIEQMKEDDYLSLYAIGEEAVPVFEEVSRAKIDNAQVSGIKISQFQPRVYDSLINVLRKVERRKIQRKVILVLSDGRDQNSRFTKEQLVSVLGETGIPVSAVGFKILASQSLSNLNEIADLTGGTYYYSTSFKKISESLKLIAQNQTQGYIVNLKIRGLKADNLAHSLQVMIDGRDIAGKGQKIFIAIKNPIPRWVKWVVLVLVLLSITILVVLTIVFRIQKRRRMGITRRRCSECGNRLKDSWDDCPFCKYLPDIKKKKKKKKGKKDA